MLPMVEDLITRAKTMTPADARRVAAAAYPGMLNEVMCTALVVERSDRAGIAQDAWLESYSAVLSEVNKSTWPLSDDDYAPTAWQIAGPSLGLAAACLVLLDQDPPAIDEESAWLLMQPLHALYDTGEPVLDVPFPLDLTSA